MIEQNFTAELVMEEFSSAEKTPLYRPPSSPKHIVPRAERHGRVVFIMKDGKEVQNEQY